MEENQGKILVERKTVETQIKLFMFHLFTFSHQQHTDLTNSFLAFCKSFSNTAKYIERAEFMQFYVVKWFVKRWPEIISTEKLKEIDLAYTLAELDWAYYRAIVGMKKLNYEYSSSSRTRRRYNKKIQLAEIVNIMGKVRASLYNDLVEIAGKYRFEVPIELPSVSRHDNSGVGIDAQKR